MMTTDLGGTQATQATACLDYEDSTGQDYHESFYNREKAEKFYRWQMKHWCNWYISIYLIKHTIESVQRVGYKQQMFHRKIKAEHTGKQFHK